MSITAIVLAAGLSKRMGTDKLLLPVLGRPMLLHTISLVESLNFTQRILICQAELANTVIENKWVNIVNQNHECTQFIEDVRENPLTNPWNIVININPEFGQSHSVTLGVKSSFPESTLIFFTADQPFLDADTVRSILEANDGKHIVCPADHSGFPRSPNLFPPSFRDDLLALSGDQGGRTLRQMHPERTKMIAIQNEAALFDIDTPETYEKIKRL